MSRNYKFHNPAGIYFVSFAVVNWIDIFVRRQYFDIVIDSLEYCVKSKGLELNAYCIMPSHVHLIFQSHDKLPSDILRDLKKHTSKKLKSEIENSTKESRKDWVLEAMRTSGKGRSNMNGYQLWQQNNHPIELWSNKVIDQKLDYLHNNPVEAGFVDKPEKWLYSSAQNYVGDIGPLEVVKLV